MLRGIGFSIRISSNRAVSPYLERTEKERNFAACSRPTLARGQTADRCCLDGTHSATRLRRSRNPLRPLRQAGVFPCSAHRPASVIGRRNRAGRFSAALAQRGPVSNFARSSRALAFHHGPQPRPRFSTPQAREAAPPRRFGFRYSFLPPSCGPIPRATSTSPGAPKKFAPS